MSGRARGDVVLSGVFDFIERRSDRLCLRTGDFLKSQGWTIDEELWANDDANCSPCD
ncbi:hypothetical protein AB0L47_36765 [Streptomyces bobili]|uniref:hypothetical protein n=1 Tax=Streptomyces bobili TaxID=67280 RepID=UPI00344793C5